MVYHLLSKLGKAVNMGEYSKANLCKALREVFYEGEILEDEPMSLYTTFEIGGMADFMVEPSSVEQIVGAINAARMADSPYWVIGCGSNVLVSDAGLRGLVIHLGEPFSAVKIDGTRITAQAGATNKTIANIALEHSLTGYEFASGIPGSVGGAAIMNAGAYDEEFKGVATGVICLDSSLNVVELNKDEAEWGYRSSRMAREGLIVLSVTMELRDGEKADIAAKMADLKERRESKQPLEFPSAGSTFKRPVGYFAGKLIDDAGMRGHRCGGASVSTKHAGFVINELNATARDVRNVIEDVQSAVEEQFGVKLETEVRMIGFEFGDEPREHGCKVHGHKH